MNTFNLIILMSIAIPLGILIIMLYDNIVNPTSDVKIYQYIMVHKITGESRVVYLAVSDPKESEYLLSITYSNYDLIGEL